MQPWLGSLALALAWTGIGLCQPYTIKTVAGGALPNNIPALSASLGGICGIAIDTAGNVYLADCDYNVIWRRDIAGTLTRVAGNGTAGFSGDNGLATNAQLNWPADVAVDSAGDLYIVDEGNSRIRKVSGGVITTVAGNGTDSFSGDNGPATSAGLSYPEHIALDSAGNLYITDAGNSRIRKVSNGVITTVWETCQEWTCTWPGGIAVDFAGNLYLAEGDRIRKLSGGVATTVAGTRVAGYSGDNGPATQAQLNGAWFVAVDSAGDLYIADSNNHRIRKVSGGVITTVAGTGTPGFSGDNGPATQAQLNGPGSVAADSAGNLYIADGGNFRIRKVSGGVITTIAGIGTPPGYGGDNGSATDAQLLDPKGVALDSAGNLYILDGYRVRMVSNGVITTVAGIGTQGFSGDNGPASNAQLSYATGVTVDHAGNLYVADTGNGRIRKVSGGVITTVAGNGTRGYSGDNGPAIDASLNWPLDVAVDSVGDLYIVDRANGRIRKVSNGVITTVAGNGGRGYGGDNGPATSAGLYNPGGVAVDSAGNLYIADEYNHRIRKVSNGVITTVAGIGTRGYSGDDGPATNARLNGPSDVAVDSDGNLYIADSGNSRIRKVSGGVITTIAGTGIWGYSGDNGLATSAQVNPYSVAVDGLGNIYFSNVGSHRVRVLTPGAPSCRQSVSTTDLGVAAAGGTLALSIQTGSGCPWSLKGLPDWLTVSGSAQGTGPATVTLVAGGNGGGSRTGLVDVDGVLVPIRQMDAAACGGSSSCTLRSLPHLAVGGEWTTVLSAVSSGTGPASYSISFYGDSGASVALPFTGGLGKLSTLSDGVLAQGMQYYEAEDPSAPVQAAWGLVTADASVEFHAMFRRRASGGVFYEAAVPSSGGYSSFIVPFDATTFAPAGTPALIGLAMNNFNPSAWATVVCTARDQLGEIIPNAVFVPPLSPLGHYADYRYPALTGKRGTLSCTADTLVSAIALRFLGTGAFSTLPVIVK